MSLLMDALRKAEQQKRQGAEHESASGIPDGDRLSLEPLTPGNVASPTAGASAAPQGDNDRRLPELPQSLEDLDDQFFTSDPRLQQSIRALANAKLAAKETVPPADDKPAITSREAAQNMFAAKQAAATVSHGFAIAVGVATMIAVVVIGVYFYWQMQPKGGLASGTSLSGKLPAVHSPPAAPIVAANAPLVSAPSASLPVAVPSATPPSRMPTDGTLLPADRSAKRRAQEPATAVPRSAGLSGQPETVIRLSSSTAKPDAAMEKAHDAFNRGDVELARSIWQKALLSDSRDTNALHGLAAIARQENKPELAAAIYRRLLGIDPKDVFAHSLLLSLENPADARQTESRLKGLLAEQPNSPQLNFTLGNLYMGDSRWADAQQAYFRAHVADPANPDYLYNLAVSLDHLHQDVLAAQYYARALAAARSLAGTFDPAQAQARLKALQSDPSK